MPTFGEYETVGDPIWVTEERSHASTVWKAQRSGASDGRLYSIKCFAPRRRGTSTEETVPKDTLDEDRGLEFIESVKQLKKAHSEGGRGLAPIYAFGTSDVGVWYLTDFCPRKTLKEFIARQGQVKNKALEHVVYCVATGCLALQRSTGRSHVNLKASNVLLVGRARPLHNTPLHLIDPRSVSPTRAPGLDRDERGTVNELIHQIGELQDLRAIGELILQLVEGRLIESGYDYNYPLAPSPAWNNLGKHGERWRQWCNRLLSPQLSLSDINLELLAKEFRPGPIERNRPLIVAVIGGMVLVAALVIFIQPFLQKWSEQRRVDRARGYTNALEAAGVAFRRDDYPKAITEAKRALGFKPNDLDAQKLKTEAERQQGEVTRLEQDFKTAMGEAQAAYGQKDYTKAIAAADRASILKPNDAAAKKLKTDAQSAQDAVVRLEQDFRTAMEEAQAAYGQKDYAKAIAAADRASILKPNDVAAKKLKTDAQTAQGAVARVEQDFKTAMEEAQAAYGRKDYSKAMAAADRASILKPNDAPAKKLKTDAQTAQGAVARVEQDFRTAMEEAQAAHRQKDYTKAAAAADRALVLKPNDVEARRLKTEAAQGLAAKLEQDFKTAMEEAQAAYGQKDYAKAIAAADRASLLKPNEAAAKKMKTDAQTAQGAVARVEQDFRTAMEEAQAAHRQKDYTKAAAAADRALVLKPNDVEARRLKTEAAQGLAAKLEQDFKTAMEEAQAAYGQKDYPKAIAAADRASLLKPNEAAAKKMKTDAQTAQGAVARVEQDFRTAMEEAQAAHRQKDYTKAAAAADRALVLKPNDVEARRLKTEAAQGLAAKLEQDFKTAMEEAQAAYGQKDYAKAIAAADRASLLKPNEAAAKKMKTDAQTAQGAVARVEQDFRTAMEEAQAAHRQKDYTKAAAAADRALVLKPNDVEARRLKTEAAQGLAAKLEQDFKTAMEEAQAAYGQKDYPKAIAAADRASLLKPNEAAAKKMKTDAQTAQGAVARVEQDFRTAMEEAQAAHRQKDYTKAAAAADRALVLKPNDVEARRLKTEAAQGLAAKLEQDFKTAMEEAQAAYGQKDYPKAIAAADRASLLKPNEAAAKKMKTDAQTAQGAVARVEQDFKTAMEEAQAAHRQKDYTKAAAAADRALTLKPNDVEARRLKTEAAQGLVVKLEQAYRSADDAFTGGSYDQALKVCEAHNGTDRFDKLSQQIRGERDQLKELTDAVNNGHYETALQANLPDKLPFRSLRKQATEENRALQAAKQEMSLGEYAFIERLEEQNYKEKPPFVALLNASRKERADFKELQAMQKSNKRQEVLKKIAELPEEVRSKKAFKDLAELAGTESAIEPPITNGVPPHIDIGALDKRLEEWEFKFNVKKRPPGFKAMPKLGQLKFSYVDKVDQMEADYKAAGRLPNSELAKRLDDLRERIRLWP